MSAFINCLRSSKTQCFLSNARRKTTETGHNRGWGKTVFLKWCAVALITLASWGTKCVQSRVIDCRPCLAASTSPKLLTRKDPNASTRKGPKPPEKTANTTKRKNRPSMRVSSQNATQLSPLRSYFALPRNAHGMRNIKGAGNNDGKEAAADIVAFLWLYTKGNLPLYTVFVDTAQIKDQSFLGVLRCVWAYFEAGWDVRFIELNDPNSDRAEQHTLHTGVQDCGENLPPGGYLHVKPFKLLLSLHNMLRAQKTQRSKRGRYTVLSFEG